MVLLCHTLNSRKQLAAATRWVQNQKQFIALQAFLWNTSSCRGAPHVIIRTRCRSLATHGQCRQKDICRDDCLPDRLRPVCQPMCLGLCITLPTNLLQCG